MSRRTSSDSEYVPRHHWESLAWTEYGMDAKLDVLMRVLPADLVEGPIARLVTSFSSPVVSCFYSDSSIILMPSHTSW